MVAAPGSAVAKQRSLALFLLLLSVWPAVAGRGQEPQLPSRPPAASPPLDIVAPAVGAPSVLSPLVVMTTGASKRQPEDRAPILSLQARAPAAGQAMVDGAAQILADGKLIIDFSSPCRAAIRSDASADGAAINLVRGTIGQRYEIRSDCGGSREPSYLDLLLGDPPPPGAGDRRIALPDSMKAAGPPTAADRKVIALRDGRGEPAMDVFLNNGQTVTLDFERMPGGGHDIGIGMPLGVHETALSLRYDGGARAATLNLRINW